MAYSTPKTNWATGDIIGSDDLNRIESNIEWLATRPISVASNTVSATLNSATWANLTNPSINHTTVTGRVLLLYHITVDAAANGQIELNLTDDGVSIVSDTTPLVRSFINGGSVGSATRADTLTMQYIVSGITGTNLFRAKYRMISGSCTHRYSRFFAIDV